MTLDTYLIYLVTVFIFFAHPPGPSQILFMAGSIQHGVRVSLPIMAGDLFANSLQIVIAGFGLAGLIAVSGDVFSVVKWAGVAYLVYIGVTTILAAKHTRSVRPVAPKRSALFRRGFITSAANPYAVVFFAALFPQFIDTGLPFPPQVAILGATYIVIDGTILAIMGAAAARLFRLLGSKIERWVGVFSGLGLLGAATMLALRGEPGTAE